MSSAPQALCLVQPQAVSLFIWGEGEGRRERERERENGARVASREDERYMCMLLCQDPLYGDIHTVFGSIELALMCSALYRAFSRVQL